LRANTRNVAVVTQKKGTGVRKLQRGSEGGGIRGDLKTDGAAWRKVRTLQPSRFSERPRFSTKKKNGRRKGRRERDKQAGENRKRAGGGKNPIRTTLKGK